MELYFTYKVKVNTKIKKYIKDIVEEFPDNITKLTSTPVSDLMFQVSLDPKHTLLTE